MLLSYIGDILYFASTFDYKALTDPANDDPWPASANYTACELGVKLRVFIEDREVIPVVEDDGSGFDFANTETVKDLETAIGHLGRTLILAQFSIEQRVRSEGMRLCSCF